MNKHQKTILKLPAKIAFFMLSVLTLLIFAATIVGSAFFIEFKFYTESKEKCFASAVRYEAFDEMNSIFDRYKNNEDPNALRSDKTNLIVAIFGENGKMLFANKDSAHEVRDWMYNYGGAIKYDGNNSDEPTEALFINAAIDMSFPEEDVYRERFAIFSPLYDLRYMIYVIMAASIILFAVFFSCLMVSAARRNDSDELHFGPIYKMPLDLLIALVTVPLIFLFTGSLVHTSSVALAIISWVLFSILAANAIIGIFVTVSARVKGKTLLKNNLIYKILWLLWIALGKTGKGLLVIGKSFPLIWKGILISILIAIVNFFMLLSAMAVYPTGSGSALLWWWLIKEFIVLAFIFYCLVCLKKLIEGGEAIANGDTAYKTDTSKMLGDFRKHGENLNSIADGMAKTIEERLRSERMKTELITNVSHDIKTPLTSIINYSELIEKEECNCEKHKEYSEVLKRKSEKLKSLLSDLVEVSKASSGALEVTLLPCDAGVLLNQIYGEYEERCRESKLELVIKPPAEQMTILTDAAKIWRVFENIMNNACKYSLAGSRVYVSVEKLSDIAIFSVRNTSAKPLDISPAELMERFVRGDASRSTEGSGLGLSIAESLTKIQGGKMDIVIDGDLFKVRLAFKITQKAQP